MRAQRPHQQLLERMLRWVPDVVIVVLGGNDITSRCQPRDISLDILKLCRLVKARGVATVVVAGICQRWAFCDNALTSDRFTAIGSAIDRYVRRYFPVSSMVHVREDVHWLSDGVHLSEEGMAEYMESLRLKLAKIFKPKDLVL
jgi:lysophospholipase L1-like esterase